MKCSNEKETFVRLTNKTSLHVAYKKVGKDVDNGSSQALLVRMENKTTNFTNGLVLF